MPTALLNTADSFRLFFRQLAIRAIAQNFRQADYCRQRRAKLMTHAGQKIVLQVGQSFKFLVGYAELSLFFAQCNLYFPPGRDID